MPLPPDAAQWRDWLRRLRSIAEAGLMYGRDRYDLERYRELQEITAQLTAALTAGEPDALLASFQADPGYVTPKVDVRAAVFQEGRILMVRERSDGLWTLPGGWADPGQSPSEAAVLEVRQESGYEVRPVRLAGLFDREHRGYPPFVYSTWKAFILCELTGGAPLESSMETDGVGFFERGALPPLSLTRVMPAEVDRMFDHLAHPEWPADFD